MAETPSFTRREVPTPAPTAEGEHAPEKKLLNKDMIGAQAAALLGEQPKPGEQPDKSKIEAIARGGKPNTEKATKASLNERDEYWKDKQHEKAKWEKDMNSFLTYYKNKPQAEFFKRLGLDLQNGATAKDVYHIFMREHKGDIGYFADLIVKNNTAEEINENTEIIQKFGKIYGKNSAKVSSLLAEGIKNAQTHPDQFFQEASNQFQKGDHMPGSGILKTLDEQAEQWDGKVRKAETRRQEEERLRQDEEKLRREAEEEQRQQLVQQTEASKPPESNPLDFIHQEVMPRLEGTRQLLLSFDKQFLADQMDPARMKALADKDSFAIPLVAKLIKEKHARAEKITTGLEFLEKIPNPQQQFVHEIAGFYRSMTNASMDGLSPSEHLKLFARRLEDLHTGTQSRDLPAWCNTINEQTYPLIVNFLKDFNDIKIPFYEAGSLKAKIGMPEISRGLVDFLRANHQSNIHPVGNTEPGGFFGSVERTFGETFFSRELARTQTELPQALLQIQQLLPNNGPEFAHKIYEAADYITSLQRQGKTDEEIKQLLFK